MSSSQSQSPQPPRSASSANQPDAQAKPPESVPQTKTPMDQISASTLAMDSSTDSAPDELSAPTVDASDTTEVDDNSDSDAILRQQPIPPASELMQYRAIGLIRGKYTASEEQFTRGTLITEDGVAVDAVLLGRVMSLVKKHLDLEQSHLWVVYPRTRNKDNDLHAQIVGVWEPEKLNKAVSPSSVEADADADVDSEPEPESEPAAKIETDPQEDYFSIRGEVLFYSPEEERLIVKIQQSPRKTDEEGKSFKLNLKGVLDGKVVGYFWDLNVQRQDNLLVVQDGTMIALVPPKKRGKTKKPFRSSGGRPSGGARKRWDGPPREGQRPSGDRRGDRPGDRSNVGAPPARREALPKPIKKKPANPD